MLGQTFLIQFEKLTWYFDKYSKLPCNLRLIHFCLMFPFYIPWKHRKIFGFLFSGSLDRNISQIWTNIIMILKSVRETRYHKSSLSKKRKTNWILLIKEPSTFDDYRGVFGTLSNIYDKYFREKSERLCRCLPVP